MRTGAVAAAVLAGVGAAVALAPEPGPRPVPPRESARRRALYGVVVTSSGDPVPGVRLEVEGASDASSDTAGEFCVFLGTNRPALATARREGFRTRALVVPAGEDDVEALLRLELSPGPDAGGPCVFHVVDACSRGVAGADVRVLDDRGAEIARCVSAADGSVRWRGPADGADRFDLRVRTTSGATATRRGVRLPHGVCVPVEDPATAHEFVALHVEGDVAEGARVALSDGAGRPLVRGVLRDRRFETLVPARETLWCRVDDGATTILRRLARPRAVRLVRTPGRRVELPAREDLARACPVLLPSLGDTGVAVGPPGIDPSSDADADAIPLRRFGGALVSPELDVAETWMSVRPRRDDVDVRILADLESPGGAAHARVATGRGEVVLRIEESDVREELVATLARRGGPYRSTLRVAPAQAAVWKGLCCGAFSLTVAREPRSPGGVRVEEIRRVVVAPGERVFVTVRPEAADSERAVLSTRRRGVLERGR